MPKLCGGLTKDGEPCPGYVHAGSEDRCFFHDNSPATMAEKERVRHLPKIHSPKAETIIARVVSRARSATELSRILDSEIGELVTAEVPGARRALAVAALARVQLEAIRDARLERLEQEFEKKRNSSKTVTYEVITRQGLEKPSIEAG